MKLEFREAPNGFLNKLSYRDQKIVTKQPDEGLNEGVSEGVNEGVNKLLNLIARYPGIRVPDLESNLKVPGKTIERWLRSLRNGYKVEFRGSAKTGGYFILNSFREAIGDVNEGVSEGVNEGVNGLLNLISQYPGIRLPNLETELKVPKKTIERWLKILREQNKIEFRGAAKTGGYFVIGSNLAV